MRKLEKNRPLKGRTLEELSEFMQEQGEPAFRGEQLFRWIYQKGAASFDEITTLSKDLRTKLSREHSLERGTVIRQTGEGQNETVKFLIELEDGKQIEAVFIPSKDRVTICVSSQVGCAVDCDFCATGKMGFHRHLDAGEIFEQYRILQDYSDRDITNIVFMGMGEPFNNYDEVIRAAYLFNDDKGPNIGRQRITISTSGILPRILQYTNEEQPFKLAISLNATRDKIRSELMPLNQRWTIGDLLNAAKRYTAMTGNRITFEYVLIDGYSDSESDARRLKSMLQDINCKLNVIPFNDIDSSYKRPPERKIEAFLGALHPAPFPLTVRWSRGEDINAACGQLQTEYNEKKRAQT
ncbi:MAG: 23S rRNA (adenine(2503)-C(2))-methyltransferase RlmN [Candidatus Marinimicrobia bacterium]|nr:23S rRNA (adenine(2503)-C(2))-methyltransferase RlmN [Candidatus Neomarinimicrobiota bacterium]MCF7829209.1 23S rRNA (adenine(2503)-C(2))-methyltransferase RlmN [Candidatus Neomarinimicrobiota bacterium]MCF7881138.1 23S rRNA (adenine(2503)-C(2))-methyltransferase RlmN [Candidatus Neomarinimicrobiota bacterium]